MIRPELEEAEANMARVEAMTDRERLKANPPIGVQTYNAQAALNRAQKLQGLVDWALELQDVARRSPGSGAKLRKTHRKIGGRWAWLVEREGLPEALIVKWEGRDWRVVPLGTDLHMDFAHYPDAVRFCVENGVPVGAED